MRNFEERFGYPPGDNRLLVATQERGCAAVEALAAMGAPSELIEFYEEVDRLYMSDVGNAFIIFPYEDVVGGEERGRPTCISGFIDDEIVVFGMDGGGGLFALSVTTGQVYRLGGGALIGAVYEVDEYGAIVIQSNFWEFLDYLYAELAGFVSAD